MIQQRSTYVITARKLTIKRAALKVHKRKIQFFHIDNEIGRFLTQALTEESYLEL